jgi:hypothetical protein
VAAVYHVETVLYDFQRALVDRLTEMRAALGAIESDPRDTRERHAPGAIVGLQLQADPTDTREATTRTCNRCFRELFSALVLYVDNLVAIKRTQARGLQRITGLPPGPIDPARLGSWFQDTLRGEYIEVSTNNRLSLKKKLAELGPIASELQEQLADLSLLRNCLEHHGGVVAKEELRLHYLVRSITIDGDPVASLPARFEAGQAIGARVDVVPRVLKAEERVSLTEEEVEGVALFFKHIAGPAVLCTAFPPSG